jgi:hypothetical protein
VVARPYRFQQQLHMTKRLVDEYQPGDPVEVFFTREDIEEWRRGRAVSLQHPGVWVRLDDGSMWFVTNTRRIRKLADAGG